MKVHMRFDVLDLIDKILFKDLLKDNTQWQRKFNIN